MLVVVPSKMYQNMSVCVGKGPKICGFLNHNHNNNQPYLRVTLNSKADKPVALISGSN